MNEESVLSVSEYIELLNERLSEIKRTVQGEVSDIKVRPTYTTFTLHDSNDESSLRCMVWNNRLESSGVDLKDGMEVKIFAAPDVHKLYGFSVKAQSIIPIGEGALKIAFEKLKKRLEGLGYFSIERKRPIPEFVHHIGLITSSFGDAINDFRTHLGKFNYKIDFLDVRVEGESSLGSIIGAIEWFNNNPSDIEVIVLTRGGGSLESLQSFNNEEIAKAIYSSKIPVITAIGHENDTTIADLVADYRASTPTDAGKFISTPWREASLKIDAIERNINYIFLSKINNMEIFLNGSVVSLKRNYERFLNDCKSSILKNEKSLLGYFRGVFTLVDKLESEFKINYQKYKSQIVLYNTSLNSLTKQIIANSKTSINSLKQHLEYEDKMLTSSNPELKLQQGYSITRDSKGKIAKDAKQFVNGDIISIQLARGGIDGSVTKTR